MGATLQIHSLVWANFDMKYPPRAVERDGSQFHNCYPIYRQTILSAWLLAHDRRHVGGTVACHHSNRNRACSRRVVSFFEKIVDTPTPLRDLSEHCQQQHIYTHGMTKTCSCKQSAKRWLPLIGRLATNIKDNRDMAQRSSRATRCPHCVHGDISV